MKGPIAMNHDGPLDLWTIPTYDRWGWYMPNMPLLGHYGVGAEYPRVEIYPCWP